MSLFVSGAYPEFANWTMSGEAIFMVMLGGVSTFLGPVAGTVLLLLLNDVVTRRTEYHGLRSGTVILLFALGLRKGLTRLHRGEAAGRRREAAAIRAEKDARMSRSS